MLLPLEIFIIIKIYASLQLFKVNDGLIMLIV